MLNQEDMISQSDTAIDSVSDSENKWANHEQYFSVFVSRAVQKVMLVGCDWWFSIRTFLQLRNDANLYRCKFSLLGQFGSLVFEQTESSG